MSTKLPFYKTTIRDKSQFIDIGGSDTGINIATIINSSTGPMERVSLTSFDDLTKYFCTGSSISQLADETVQCVGALLNTSSVDVIRVGTAKLKLGKTDDNKLIYTDSNYNLLDTVSIVKITDKAKKPQTLTTKMESNEIQASDIKLLTKYVAEDVESVISYSDSSICYLDPIEFYDTDTVDAKTSFLSCNYKISGTNEPVRSNTYLEINNRSFYINDDVATKGPSLNNPEGIPATYDYSSKKFLTLVSKRLSEVELPASSIIYDFTGIEEMSTSLEVLVSENKYRYSKNHVFTDGLWFKKDDTYFCYKDVPSGDNISTENIVKVEAIDNYTDFIEILYAIEASQQHELISLDSADLFVSAAILRNEALDVTELEGVYKTDFIPMEQVPQNYSISVNNLVYYVGEEPSELYPDVIEYIQLDKDNQTFDNYIRKLTTQLLADLTIGFKSKTSIIVAGKPEFKYDENLLDLKVSRINQTSQVQNSRFALVAKFPTNQNLFSYSFVKNTEITEFDIFDISWLYNQISGSMSISFDENSVDGYGTSLYYSRFNDGDTSNDYFQLIQLADEITCTEKDTSVCYVPAFGQELLISEPTETDYADAIMKFLDYEDKQYSFIWDSGHSSSILAKAMHTVATDKNAQLVPSFPAKAKTVEEIMAYNDSLGLDSPLVMKVVPGHKGTYCGNFLTTVPGSLSYIVARVNSFKNGANECQPLFGPVRGVVAAPNLVWNVNKTDRQKLADARINTIVKDINGTYLSFNLTGVNKTSYLSQDQNMYMSNVIAHVCQEYNPKIISEMNTPELWATIVTQLTKLISERFSGKSPSFNAFRVICNEKLNTQDVIESKTVKYKVEVQYNIATAYVDAYVDVVRLNSW